MEAALMIAMGSVTHDPKTYAQYHQRGILKWLKRVVEYISINQTCIKLSLRMITAHPYYCKTAMLVVMPDPAVPDFEGEMVYSSGMLTETAVLSVARKIMMKLLTWFWQTKFAGSSFRLMPRAVLPDEGLEAIYLEMFAAPVQLTGGDQPLVHTTGSYLYDLDHVMVNLSQESKLLYEGFHAGMRLIDQLEHEIQGWNRIYTVAHQDTRLNRVNYVEASRMLEIETQWRTVADENLHRAEIELQKLRAEKAEWELKDKVCDREEECRQLQTQVDDQQNFMTLRAYFESTVEDQVKELGTRLERNMWNIAKLTHTIVFLRDKAAHTMQTWELSDSIRVDEIHELRNQLPRRTRLR
jgi:hypothetical protein